MSTLSNTRFPVSQPYIGYVTGFMLSQYPLEIANEATTKLEATWLAIMKDVEAERGYPFINVFKIEPTADEQVQETGVGGQVLNLYQKGGVDKFHWANPTPKLKRKLFSFHDKILYCAWFTNKGYIVGLTDSATQLKFLFEQVRVSVNYVKGTETETEKITISLQSMEPDSKIAYAMSVLPSFDTKNLVGLYDVNLATSNPGATTATVTVTTDLEGTAVTGLVKADFALDKAGTPIVITTVTDNGDGTYSFLYPSQTGTLTVDLVAAASITAGLNIESTGSKTIVIP